MSKSRFAAKDRAAIMMLSAKGQEMKLLSLYFRESGNAVSSDAFLNEVWGLE